MAAEFKKSVPTIRTWLRHAQAMQYLTVSGNNIYLTSYENVCEVHGLQAAFITVTCEAHALPVLFYALEIEENKARQDYAFTKRLHNNQALAGALTELLNCDVEQLRPALLAAQIAGFVKRSESSSTVYAINADTGRNEKTTAKKWQYRSKASVYDIKRALIAAGVATVERRTFSSDSASYCKKRFTSYEQATGKRTTWLPDQITLNPLLFGA